MTTLNQTPSDSRTLPRRQQQGDPLAPLFGYPWIVSLSEDAHIQDVVTPPVGTNERRPIVVAVHGAGDRPNWACGGWRITVESYAFVTCPMGLSMSGETFGWSNSQSIQLAVDRSLAALRNRFGPYLRHSPMIYAGFSQGAALAAPFLVANAERFPRAALAEGGYNYLTDAQFAQNYRRAGGERILIVCGTPHCFATAARAKVVLEKAGLEATISGDRLSGHNLNVRMQDALRGDWSKLVRGFAGWESFKLASRLFSSSSSGMVAPRPKYISSSS